ncbi:MAG: hypothetical protein WC804_10815 [Sphingomonas sp.]|jgi:hypothetical protein
MNNELPNGSQRLIWVEPVVESLDIRATESNWGIHGTDGFPAQDSGS